MKKTYDDMTENERRMIVEMYSQFPINEFWILVFGIVIGVLCS